jgi:hypothetical protein
MYQGRPTLVHQGAADQAHSFKALRLLGVSSYYIPLENVYFFNHVGYRALSLMIYFGI